MSIAYEQDTYSRISPFAKRWIATYGVMAHCEEHRCYWVLDALASYVPDLNQRDGVDYFLIVKVTVNPDQTAVFTIEQEDPEEGENVVLIRQELDYTDLKESLTFWAICESSGREYDPKAQTVVLLPEEY